MPSVSLVALRATLLQPCLQRRAAQRQAQRNGTVIQSGSPSKSAVSREVDIQRLHSLFQSVCQLERNLYQFGGEVPSARAARHWDLHKNHHSCLHHRCHSQNTLPGDGLSSGSDSDANSTSRILLRFEVEGILIEFDSSYESLSGW